MLNNGQIGIFVQIVDANGKTSGEIAQMYMNSARKDPLGRVAFCTDAEADPRLADRFARMIMAYEGEDGDFDYIMGDIIDYDLAYDPDAPKGFKRKIMGAFSDLLPKEFEKEMKSTWLLLDNLQELDPEEAAGIQCEVGEGAMGAEDLLKDRESDLRFTYFK